MSEYIQIDKGWRFREMANPIASDTSARPMGAEALSFDDSEWECVNLPHDWSIVTPQANEPYVHAANDNCGQNGFFHGGIGWYRKWLSVPEVGEKEYLLEIGGSYRKSEIWVNGIYAGGEENGYFSYCVDLTPYLTDGDNLVVIRCDNVDTPNCRWYTGSGLYRHVKLVVREKTHFAHWGIALTTPCAKADRALVRVKAALEGSDGGCEVKAVIFDPEGRQVAEGRVRAAVRDGSGMAEMDIPVETPALWSIDSPAMYTAEMTLLKNRTEWDKETIPFGIRDIEYRRGAGFLLNGVPTKMKGICMHHDGGPLGAAVPETVWEARLKLLKELGCNAIRTSHNPPAPEVLDLCDRMGFVVMDEFCDKWEPPHFVGFAKNWKKDMTEWIHRDRNHPGIIMWSVGNENDAPGSDYVLSRYRTLCDAARELDPSRPAMAAAERGPIDPNAARNHLMTRGITDFIGVNYSEIWYDEMFEIDPDILILGTENFVYMHSSKESHDARIEMNPWFDVEADPRVMGNFLWTGIDYLGESWKGWPNFGSYAGLIDITNVDKPMADFYRTLWKKDEPQVFIDIYRMPVSDIEGKLGMWGSPKQDRNWVGEGEIEFSTYTSCEEVEVFVNGKSLGTQKLADQPNRIIRWKTTYEAGEVTAVGKIGGEEAARMTLKTPKAPAAIKLVPTHTALAANGWDTSCVTMTLVDEDGTLCPWKGTAEFEVEGEGTLAAVGNGGLHYTLPFTGNAMTAFNDRVTAYVKAGDAKGTAKLIARAEGLTASLEIEIG